MPDDARARPRISGPVADREPGVAVHVQITRHAVVLDGRLCVCQHVVEPIRPAAGSFVDNDLWWPWTPGGRLLAALAGAPLLLTLGLQP